jgi:hypothetical protein
MRPGEREINRLVTVGGIVIAVLFGGCGRGSPSTQVLESRAPVEYHHHASGKREAVRKQSQARAKLAALRAKKQQELEHRVARRAKERRRAKHRREREARKQKEKEKRTANPGVAPITAEEFHYFTATDLSNWEIAYGVCAVTPEKQLAKEFHTEQNFGSIGQAYGAGYTEPFNIAAEEGCMAALLDSKTEREAAFNLMEENE